MRVKPKPFHNHCICKFHNRNSGNTVIEEANILLGTIACSSSILGALRWWHVSCMCTFILRRTHLGAPSKKKKKKLSHCPKALFRKKKSQHHFIFILLINVRIAKNYFPNIRRYIVINTKNSYFCCEKKKTPRQGPQHSGIINTISKWFKREKIPS